MNQIKESLVFLFIALVSFSLFSCTKNFEKYNTNPNALSQEDINQDNVYLGGFFKQMEESVLPVGGTGTISANLYQQVNNLCGGIYGCYFGMTHNWNAAGDQTTYNFTSESWNSAAFNSFYNNIVKNFDTISVYAANHPDIIAVAKIIKVEAAHRVVDMYGPIPYFKTATSLGSFGSPYDSMDSIYYSFFNDLDSSISVLKSFITLGANPLENFDAVYGGDYKSWVKFANSLKLRLAMRMVYVNENFSRDVAEEAVNSEFGVITENSGNAVMRGVNGVQYNNPLKTLSEAYQEARMSANMQSFLEGYQDPRINSWFNYSNRSSDDPNSYRGIRSGNIISDPSKYIPFSSLKTDFDLVWLSASEVYLLRAEGVVRGWDMGGSAKELYEEGVQKSFEQWNAGNADAYLADDASTAAPYIDPINGSNNVSSGSGNLSTITIKWDDNGSFEKKLERILTQKWIALYPDGQEAWSEYRRTGYPRLFGVIKNLGNDGRLSENYPIKRLPYPKSEYQNNNANLVKGIELLGGPDLGGTKLWWDKK